MIQERFLAQLVKLAARLRREQLDVAFFRHLWRVGDKCPTILEKWSVPMEFRAIRMPSSDFGT